MYGKSKTATFRMNADWFPLIPTPFGFEEGVLPVLRPSEGWTRAALGGPPWTLPCLFWWAGQSLTARCSLSSAWPVNSTSPGLQRRGERVGHFVKRSEVKVAVEYMRIYEETLWFCHVASYSVFPFRWCAVDCVCVRSFFHVCCFVEGSSAVAWWFLLGQRSAPVAQLTHSQ